ncbi:protein of unknown function [Kyrpidia spormannii]|uniref:Uncharacterized protein n=1 Tax=Kyrpidia spormannii TaxID=2055160 RepID=A0ACA8Z709_9BACL|nr:protein of unknown function [Kyrpidia spormannii]
MPRRVEILNARAICRGAGVRWVNPGAGTRESTKRRAKDEPTNKGSVDERRRLCGHHRGQPASQRHE